MTIPILWNSLLKNISTQIWLSQNQVSIFNPSYRIHPIYTEEVRDQARWSSGNRQTICKGANSCPTKGHIKRKTMNKQKVKISHNLQIGSRNQSLEFNSILNNSIQTGICCCSNCCCWFPFKLLGCFNFCLGMNSWINKYTISKAISTTFFIKF